MSDRVVTDFLESFQWIKHELPDSQVVQGYAKYIFHRPGLTDAANAEMGSPRIGRLLSVMWLDEYALVLLTIYPESSS